MNICTRNSVVNKRFVYTTDNTERFIYINNNYIDQLLEQSVESKHIRQQLEEKIKHKLLARKYNKNKKIHYILRRLE